MIIRGNSCLRKYLFLFHLVEVCVGAVGVEYFVAVHYCDEVFCVGKVDDVVGVAGEHDDALDMVATHLIVKYFICTFPAELDKSMAADNDELLPLGVVPVFALGDAGFGDVDAHLSAVEGVNEFGEGTALINVHLEVEDGFFLGQVT